MDDSNKILEKYRKYLIYSIFIVGAFLRFYKLGYKSLWFDEIHTYEDAFKNYKIWSQSHSLYFLMVRFFLYFGHSEFCLRLTSALFGTMGVFILYLAGKEIYQDKRVGILCALFVALSKFHIQYSQEARYYPVMFFLSGLSLYLYARFLIRRSFVSLILLQFVALVNYLVHPTTLVFSGLLLAWIPFILLVTPSGRDMIKSLKAFLKSHLFEARRQDKNVGKKRKTSQFPNKTSAFKKFLIVVLLICILGITAWSGWILFRKVIVQTRQVQLFKAPAEGVSATFQFFFVDHFLPYGPIIGPSTFLYKYIVGLFILFFLVGYGRTLIRHFPFGGFMILVVAATFILLFSVPIKQWYINKYVIFLYPGNILCLMFGFISLVDAGYRLLKPRLNLNPLYLHIFLYSLFLVPQTFKDFHLLRDYYRGKGINVKDAVRYASQNMGTKDVIATYGLTHGPVWYYINRYHVPASRYREITWEKGEGLRSIYNLLKSLEQGGTVWYIFGWPFDIDQKPLLKNWVESHFELVSRFPYESDDKYDVTLWKWKYAGRTLSHHNPVDLDLVFQQQQTREKAPDRLWSAGTTIFSLHTIESVCELLLRKEDMPSSFSISVLLDGRKLGEICKTPGEPSGYLESHVTIPEGTHEIRFDMMTDSRDVVMDRASFKIQSLTPDKLFIPAVNYDSVSPSYDIECRSEQDINYVFMPYNSFVGYNVSISREGFYNLSIKAKNNAFGPILYQVDIDEKPVGILSLSRANYIWEVKNFPVKLTSGEHTIDIYYISNVFRGSKAEKEDRDSFIQYLSLERLTGENDVKDQRVNINPDIMVPISRIKELGDMILTYGDILGWQPAGLSIVSEIDIPGKGRTWKALEAEIPKEVKASGFISPAIPVKPGQIVYFSLKAGVENLENHSANVMLVFMDQDLKKIGQQWINAQGITGDIPEVKFICFRGVPTNTHFISIHFTAYENSRKPFQTPGKIWFYDFQSDVQLTGLP